MNLYRIQWMGIQTAQSFIIASDRDDARRIAAEKLKEGMTDDFTIDRDENPDWEIESVFLEKEDA